VKVLYLVVRYMPFISMSFVFMLDGKRKYYLPAKRVMSLCPVPGPTTDDCLSIMRTYASMSLPIYVRYFADTCSYAGI
jgi:hypothetical protein